MSKEVIYYARPNGGRYHSKRDCAMLQGPQFEDLGYVEVFADTVDARALNPCVCTVMQLKVLDKHKDYLRGRAK